MSRFFDVVSKPARDMAAHFPTASPKQTPTDAQPQLIKLDSNENPFGPSPRAMEAMRSALATANFYPDDDSTELRRTLALHHEVSRDQILVTSGSTEMLALVCQTMLAPGLNAVTSERSFIIYSMAVHATGAQLVQSPMRGDVFDLDAVSYTHLDVYKRQVLRRDGWRCQSCGAMSNLEVHHKRFRSHSGDDSEQNLITQCSTCHASVHGQKNKIVHGPVPP